ncbi:MAG: redoxin domain-containing protein [Paludibacteraceae bacterium]|nr:redoxin domain-containing protein [Paludibacteraceae bacterium]MBQ6790854.1 redoxin domain-containing protein [Paludibacteraceae bacterium]
MLQIGDKMPAFSVADEQGRVVTDKDLLGKKTVIYFYPKDSTPGSYSRLLWYGSHCSGMQALAHT